MYHYLKKLYALSTVLCNTNLKGLNNKTKPGARFHENNRLNEKLCIKVDNGEFRVLELDDKVLILEGQLQDIYSTKCNDLLLKAQTTLFHIMSNKQQCNDFLL
ncbi:hypothetical protein STEG23_005647, partial [Scotinomys teguina]